MMCTSNRFTHQYLLPHTVSGWAFGSVCLLVCPSLTTCMYCTCEIFLLDTSSHSYVHCYTPDKEVHQWSNYSWLCLSVRLNGVCTMLAHVLYNNLFIHVLCYFILTVDYMSVEHYLIVWCRELSIPLFCIMWDIVSENMYRSSKWNDVGIDRYMYIMEDTVWSVGDLLYNTIFIMYSFYYHSLCYCCHYSLLLYSTLLFILVQRLDVPRLLTFYCHSLG